ncbi:phage tail protein [Proteus mirabilis]|uniref:phage tail protein n=2 Tax=Proteus mirabilis TaxID=584 RepID=UPI002149F0A2|nr:phage tail protein [Proteus mirabilis]MCR1832582.1 phage tail protein [Proteus mirabilis]MDM3714362.1 phage tail protein [Proteus mirabilis]
MGKGGGGGSTPRLLDDNLKNKQFLNVIDLVSEGPIEGPVGGMSGFLLNGTPVVDEDGNPNIHGVEVQWRSGTQTQEPLEDFPFVEKEIPVNVEVKKSTPILRTISDQETDRVRFTLGVSALVSQDDKGNQHDATVEMLIEVNDGSGWTHAETAKITGKISGQYLESYIIDAPKKKPFQIRVSRLTDDSKSDLLKNGTVWASYTEITDAKFSYPNSAVVGMKIDKSQYGDTPNRTYHIKGMIIQVPDNYDPESRTYTGIWTGRFKPAWSNNPAWVFYDLVTNERYGIGEMIGSFGVDKFALYAIARYCDELVDDGFGNKEPRFTFNAYITSQRKAKEVLDDLASVFRGMPLWDGQQLTCFQDRPSDPVWTYTNSNVIDGKFKYTSTAKSARHNAIEVSWVNPSNGWSEEREFIQDDDLIQRFGGVNVKKVTAFGCTSRGQAHRVGKWILQTEKLEKDSVTFSTGREGINCISGDIIEVADDSFAGVKVGGRVLSVNGSTIIIDAPIDWEYDDKGTFSFLGSSGGFEKIDIQSIDGDIVTLREIPNGLKQYGVFSISKSTLTTRLFRVITISEDKDGIYLYNCIQHEPQKERIVDNGVDFTGNPPTQNVIRIPNIERLSIAYVNDSSQVQARAMWMTTTINRNISFNVTLYKDSKVVSTGNTTDLEYYFNGFEAGDYLVGVRGRDTNGMLGNESKVQMVIGTPSAPSSIIVESGFFEIKLIPHIAVPHTLNTEFEFWFSGEIKINNINEIESKADFLSRAKFWTKGQLKPGRDYWFYVRSVNEYGKSHFVEAKGQVDGNIDAILEELAGQISRDQLAQDLLGEINSKANQIDITELHELMRINHDKILSELMRHGATIEESEKKWEEAGKLLAERINQVSTATEAQVAAIKQEQQARIETDKTEAQQRQFLATQLRGDYTGNDLSKVTAGLISAEKQARVTGDQAEAKARQSLETRMNGNVSAINKSLETLTSKQQAQTQEISTLNSNLKGKADSSVVNALNTRVTNIDGKVTSATSQVQTLSSKLDKVRADLTEFVVVDLDLSKLNENTYYPIILPLVTSRRYAFKVFRTLGQYSDNKPSYATHSTKGFAMIVEWQVSGSGWGTQSENRIIDNFDWRWTNQSPVMGPAQLTNGSVEYIYLRGGAKYQLTKHKSVNHQIITRTYTNNKQSVAPKGFVANEVPKSSEQKANATANAINQLETKVTEVSGKVTSTAQQVTRLESQVGTSSAKIEQTSKVVTDINGKISASWTMKVQQDSKGNKVITGIGLGFNAQGNSQFLVNAQNFAVISSLNGKVVTPFIVKNGQVVVNEAFIGDATITSAKIANVLQSTNFSHANKVGYQLNMRTGEEIKYGNNAQGYWIETNILKRLFDKKGTMRIRMGIW